MKTGRCYIYTRVSTSMQVDRYSLDAQKDKLKKYAEIERENILVQTMEGRRQKARESKWNGGFAPYGYKLENGELLIAEDEAEVIRIIYDKYVNTTMGASAVANYLNEHGYVKKKRQETGVKSKKIYNQEHENILSSILRCPVCGAAMYGNVNRKKKKDGTLYKDYYYYHCKHRTTVNGHRCGYKRQWKQNWNSFARNFVS